MFFARANLLAATMPMMIRTMRQMSTKADLTVSLPQRLASQKAAFWKPKPSDPVAGLGMVGILGGTIFVCMLPAVAAIFAPAAHDDH